MGCQYSRNSHANHLSREDLETRSWIEHECNENESSAWQNYKSGRTTIEFKESVHTKVWRGSAVIKAPIDILFWFLRNQTEFNSLASTIDKQVLSPELERILKRNVQSVADAESINISLLNWLIQMPSPILPRRFLVKESCSYCSDGTQFLFYRGLGNDKQKTRQESKLKRDTMILSSHINVEQPLEFWKESLVEGYMLRPLPSNYTEIYFVSSIDPDISVDEYEHLAEEHSTAGMQLVESVIGLGRILIKVESVRRYFEDPKSIWIEQVFRMSSVHQPGEMGFFPTYDSRIANFQVGSHVRGKNEGEMATGMVESFSMRGTAIIRFDNGETSEYNVKEMKNNLQVLAPIGTRVRHKIRGLGTLRQYDLEGRIHVKFDNGEYHRYKGDSWDQKIKVLKHQHKYAYFSECRQQELDIVTPLSSPTIPSGISAPRIQSTRVLKREKSLVPKVIRAEQQQAKMKADILRVNFVVAAHTYQILDYILAYSEDAKAGNVQEHSVLQQHSPSHRTMYKHVKMDSVNNRDFVYDQVYMEVDELTLVVASKSTTADVKPTIPGIVRGNIVIQGYLLEPLHSTENVSKHKTMDSDAASEPLFTRVTYLTCVEPNGFVAPKVVREQNRQELLAIIVDMKSYFHKNPKKRSGIETMGGKSSIKKYSSTAVNKTKRRSIRKKTV